MSYDDVYGLGAPCRVQLRWEGSPPARDHPPLLSIVEGAWRMCK